MRNIILFFRKASNFFFFLLLMGFCFYIIFSFNRFHKNIATHFFSNWAGKVNKQYNKLDYYAQLKVQNEKLLAENENLKNKLKENFELPDTAYRVFSEILNDTLNKGRKWKYLRAKVISNSTNSSNNYITIHRGYNQGVKEKMGVLGINNEVVGQVVGVHANFSIIKSQLHTQSKISAKLLRGGQVGNMQWDGKTVNELELYGISKTVDVKVGDSVVTSGFVDAFKYGYLIGTVSEVLPSASSNKHIIKVKTAVDYENLQFVYLVENFYKSEIDSLIKKVEQ